MEVKMKVFISYSSIDKIIANRIAKIMQDLKIDYFLDSKDINWGINISSKIKDEIKLSSHIIIIISPASLKSQWVPFELGQATALDKIVLPFLVHSSVDIPLYI